MVDCQQLENDQLLSKSLNRQGSSDRVSAIYKDAAVSQTQLEISPEKDFYLFSPPTIVNMVSQFDVSAHQKLLKIGAHQSLLSAKKN
jgi:hypothetical protein